MSFTSYLFLGAMVGWFASVIMATNAGLRAYLNILVAIVGAMAAGMAWRTFGLGGFELSVVAAGAGAIGLLLVVRAWRRA